jgi:phosphohistidine phosphatase SixA
MLQAVLRRLIEHVGALPGDVCGTLTPHIPGPRPDLRTAAAIAAAVWACLLCAVPGASAEAESELWAALRSGGHAALLRHAVAPGTGDPPGFVLGDCGTQRNLSEEGREQAKRIGALFRANGISSARVFASQWCRCLETARLLGLGPVAELPALNSFFANPEHGAEQTRALREWLAGQPSGDPVVLVSHQVNITALTGVFPRSGELVVLRRTPSGHLEMAGTIQPP